jgi:hypothetical protein
MGNATNDVIVLRMWINPDGTVQNSHCANRYKGDVILPEASLEHVEVMAKAFGWLPVMRSNPTWRTEWESYESMQRMLLNLAADIWMYVREEKYVWDLDPNSQATLATHMPFYDNTVAGRRAAELYFRAGYMVVATFHQDYILSNATLHDLLKSMVDKWGLDQVATAKIKSSCPSWTIVYDD